MKEKFPIVFSRRQVWTSIGALVLLAAAVGLYAFFFVRASCDITAVERASFLLLHQMERFDHSYQFATSAAPDKVVRPLAELQQILMDTKTVEVPGCLQAAKTDLVAYMGTVVRAFLAYQAQEADLVRDLVGQSDTHYEGFYVEMEKVMGCAPWCFR
jgi:hypothetical protein